MGNKEVRKTPLLVQILACKPVSFTCCITGLHLLISDYAVVGTQIFVTFFPFAGSKYPSKI